MAEQGKLEPLGWPLIRLALVVVIGGVAPLIDTTVVNVALHTMGTGFRVGADAIQWVTTAYLLALAVTVPVTVWASDRFGAKRLWIAGLALFLVGSGLCAVAWDLGSLVAFRAVQGVGAGIMLPVLQTILVRAAGPARTGRVLTVVMLVSTIAPIAGPLVGGAIVNSGSWRWVFVVNLPICAAAILLAVRLVPGTPAQAGKRLDVPGVLLLGSGTAVLLYALSNAATGGGTALGVWLPLGGGLALLAGFVAWSLVRGTRAAVPVRLLAHRTFGSATATLFLTGVALYGALFLIPLYFQQQRGLTALAAGSVLALQGIGSLLTRWVGSVVDRIGARLITVTGVVLCGAATLPFATAAAHTSWVLLGIALIVRGGALSAVNIAITAGAFAGLSREQVPSGSAIVRLVQQLGGAAGTALLATIVVAGGGGFHAAFYWSIGLTLAALIPCLYIPAPRRAVPAADG